MKLIAPQVKGGPSKDMIVKNLSLGEKVSSKGGFYSCGFRIISSIFS